MRFERFYRRLQDVLLGDPVAQKIAAARLQNNEKKKINRIFVDKAFSNGDKGFEIIVMLICIVDCNVINIT